jgi:hypothetical protein
MPLLPTFHQAGILGNGNQHMPARSISIKQLNDYLQYMLEEILGGNPVTFIIT